MNDKYLSEIPTGSTHTLPRGSKTDQTDLLFRFVISADPSGFIDDKSLKLYMNNTSDFISNIKEYFSDVYSNCINNLSRIIGNEWNAIKYSQEYVLFIKGVLNKEEFKEKAIKYATKYENLSENDIEWSCRFLINILDEELSSGDLSMLINAPLEAVEKALSRK